MVLLLPIPSKPTCKYIIHCNIFTSNDCSNSDSCINGLMSLVKTRTGYYISIQQIKVTLQKRVQFRLDGLPPVEREKKRHSIKDFTPPQLPSPNQKTIYKKKVLKIEKLVLNTCHACCPGLMQYMCLSFEFTIFRLPRSLVGTPLKPGDIIMEINGIPIINQNQEEVNNYKY